MDKQKGNWKTSKVIKIIIPILIVFVIAGIYFLKNQSNNAETENKGNITLEGTGKGLDAVATELEAQSIDLEQLKSYGLPIVIDFGADSCEPCKEMAPVLKELNQELQGKVIVKFVDVWKNPKASEDFPVQLIPTQFFFDKDGKPFVPKNAEQMQMTMYSIRDEHVYTAHQGGMTKEQMMAVLKEMGIND